MSYQEGAHGLDNEQLAVLIEAGVAVHCWRCLAVRYRTGAVIDARRLEAERQQGQVAGVDENDVPTPDPQEALDELRNYTAGCTGSIAVYLLQEPPVQKLYCASPARSVDDESH